MLRNFWKINRRKGCGQIEQSQARTTTHMPWKREENAIFLAEVQGKLVL